MRYLEDVARERSQSQYRIEDDIELDIELSALVAALFMVAITIYGIDIHRTTVQNRAPFIFPQESYAGPLAIPSDSELPPAVFPPKSKPATHAARAIATFTHSETTQLAGLILPDYQHPKRYETTSTSLSAKGERIFRVKVGNEAGKYVLSVVMKPGAQTPIAANASSVQIGALENVGNNTWRDVYDLTAGPEGYTASGVAALSHDWNCGFSPTDPMTPNAAIAQKVFIQAARVERLIAENQQIGFQPGSAA